MKSNSTHKQNLGEQIAAASEAVQEIAKGLPLENVASEEVRSSAAGNRIPVQAMTIAANVLQQRPEQFPSADLTGLKSAIEYEQAMAPLAAVVMSLAKRISRNIRKRRGVAAVQTLGVYQGLKVVQRFNPNDPLESELQEMENLLSTNRKRRATSVTQKEMLETKREKRKVKIAAAKAAEATAAADAASAAAKAAGIDTPATPAPVPASPVPVPH